MALCKYNLCLSQNKNRIKNKKTLISIKNFIVMSNNPEILLDNFKIIIYQNYKYQEEKKIKQRK